jgi:hypothetical protein
MKMKVSIMRAYVDRLNDGYRVTTFKYISDDLTVQRLLTVHMAAVSMMLLGQWNLWKLVWWLWMEALKGRSTLRLFVLRLNINLPRWHTTRAEEFLNEVSESQHATLGCRFHFEKRGYLLHDTFPVNIRCGRTRSHRLTRRQLARRKCQYLVLPTLFLFISHRRLSSYLALTIWLSLSTKFHTVLDTILPEENTSRSWEPFSEAKGTC